MYQIEEIEGGVNAHYLFDIINRSQHEIKEHCLLIGQLQAINTDLLNRIRLLEEQLMNK